MCINHKSKIATCTGQVSHRTLWENISMIATLVGYLQKKIIIPPLPEGGGGYTVLPLSVQDICRRIFLSNCWWQKSDIWSQASYRYLISWEAFLDPSDSYFLFAEELGYHRRALAHSSSRLDMNCFIVDFVLLLLCMSVWTAPESLCFIVFIVLTLNKTFELLTCWLRLKMTNTVGPSLIQNPMIKWITYSFLKSYM